MSSAIFRQVTLSGERQKPERLFCAAVSAFCALTRPSRLEIDQLDDLALPLFEAVTAETRRFAAAALSECNAAPPRLVRRLCDEPVSVAAPLLMRSPALRDIDLVTLIGRHGLPHARAISRRGNLNPAIAALIGKLLDRSAPRSQRTAETADRDEAGSTVIPLRPRPQTGLAPRPAGGAAEQTREKLRAMMLPAGDASAYLRLRASALRGGRTGFCLSLAALLEISDARASELVDGLPQTGLLAGLRALDLNAEQAFLVTALVMPGHFSTTGSIGRFVENFSALQIDTALELVRRWRADAGAAHLSPPRAAAVHSVDTTVR